MQLRWKLFLSYLGACAVIIAAASIAFRGVAVRATYSHMGGMMTTMMPGVTHDLEEAIAGGVEQAVLVALVIAGLVAIVASLLVAVWITRPLAHMAEAARLIAEGRYGRRVAYRARDEIGEFSEAFNQMAAKLEATEKLRAELLATIAHELRTPLTNIQGYMEGLLDGVVAEEPATYEMVRQEAGRLSRLVGDIQRLSRLEAGAERFAPRSVDASAAFRTAEMSLRPEFEDKGVMLRVEAPEGLPPVLVDPDKFQQVLLNLLANACRYTPPGGTVTVTAEKAAHEMLFLVRDTGIGIPPDDLPHIFERFYRVDKSRSSAGGGAGIGLAVVRGVIEQSGGSIQVESVLGEGTTMRFTLPLAGAAG
jgi:Signal transduction histidine kinase